MSGRAIPPAQDVVDAALRAASGSDGCVVLVEESSEVEVRFANNTTTTNGSRRDRRVTVVAIRQVEGGLAAGVARRGGDVDVVELVRAAEADAAASPPADDAMPLLGPGAAPPSATARFDLPPDRTDLSVLEPVLTELAGAFGRARSGDHVLAGYAEHRRTTEYLGTSTGLRAAHAQPTGALQMIARSADGTDSTWAGAGTAEFDDVSIVEMESRLRQGLAWAAHRVELPAGRYPVILPAEAVADLMTTALYDLSGRDAQDGRTVFSGTTGTTRIGERLSPVAFNLRSDPAEPGLECSPFLATGSSSADTSVFDNGLSLGRTEWIADGRLHRLRYHRAGAGRAGVEVSPYVDNLILDAPDATGSLADLVASTERGLLLTCLWYIREVDPATMLLTGLTRDGVYVVEDGRVVGAANNFRFNESPIDLLARATEVGASVRAFGRENGEYQNRTRVPPLRIPDFNMSSVSQAS